MMRIRWTEFVLVLALDAFTEFIAQFYHKIKEKICLFVKYEHKFPIYCSAILNGLFFNRNKFERR